MLQNKKKIESDDQHHCDRELFIERLIFEQNLLQIVGKVLIQDD